MTVVVVAEKPSVARDIAQVVGARTGAQGWLHGNGYVVTWAIGHLIGLAQPQVPMEITIMAGIAVILNIVLWTISHLRFHFPLYLVLIYPLSAVFMTVIALASMVLTMQGKALWKGRSMPKFVKC